MVSTPQGAPASAARSSKRVARCIGFALACAFGLSGAPAQAAGPTGEQRSLSRDGDRLYDTVAGDADASAVVQNPANLAYLRGLSGLLDFSFNSRRAEVRGGAVGAFVALPLPFDIFSVGLGLQQMFRGERGGETDALGLDAPHGKFSFALGVPLSRFGARGLAIGVGVSALYSGRNLLLRGGVPLVDLGLTWRANRFLSMGIAVRGVNHPRLFMPQRLASSSFPIPIPDGSANPPVVLVPTTEVAREEIDGRMSMVLDPEVALRPLGNPWFELAAGMRVAPFVNSGLPARVRPGFILQPRVRMLAGYGGFRVYAQGERIGVQRFDNGNIEDGLRFTMGLQVDAEHWGVAGGVNLAAGTEPLSGPVGGHGRLRLSKDRYGAAATPRPRKVTRFVLGDYGGERGTARLVSQIDELNRRGASTILLDLRSTPYTYAQIEEVREAVLRFRTGGGVAVAYVQGPSTRTYFLASAADRVIAHPTHQLNTLGVRLRTFYYGEILSRLGVKSDFVRIAEYKGAAEIYAAEHASAPVAAQRDQLLADAWNHVLRMIARERGHQSQEVAGWINESPMNPERAMELGVIDELAWPDEIDEKLEAWLKRKVRIEKAKTKRKHADMWGAPAHVAVLFVEGDLVTGPSAFIPFLGRRLAGSDTLTAQIRTLRKDPNVRAIVVRIASRGGSVSAAEAITRELELAAETKPVLVSMGSVAASGGYYIATAGSYIFADALTATGSIGIFYPKMDLSGLLDKFGVGMDMVGFGERANMRSWFKSYTPAERSAAQASIRFSYEQFTARVAKARSMSLEQVDKVARGRVWSGVRAIDVGLVDAYGGLREALIRTKEIAKLPADTPHIAYPPTPSLLSQLKGLFGLRIPSIHASLGANQASEGSDALDRSPRWVGSLQRGPLGAALSQLPGALWTLEAPEAMALDTWDLSFE